MLLQGKTALITGSSRGIGRGIALKLAAHGAKTAITYYTQEDEAKETLAKVRACGGDGLVIAGVPPTEASGRIGNRIAKHLDDVIHQIDDPGFRDACSGVKASLDHSVVVERRVRDFHDEQRSP